MHTTTHPLPPSQTNAAYALAELHEATLLVENPAHTTTASEFVAATAPQTATWYVADSQQQALANALANLGHGNLVWQPVDETADYVAQTAHLFPDLAIGPYTVTRDETNATSSPTTIFIPPNQAFGSGEHATTSGCLLAFEQLISPEGRHPAPSGARDPLGVQTTPSTQSNSITHALDFGAGSAILAIAAAKRLGIPVTCADNEPPAVRIALENAASNNVAPLVTSHLADTPAHPAVMAHAPYPLIFANILLTPLLQLAQPLMNALAPHGALILSGFRTDQEADIRTAYAALVPHHHHEHDGWVTLTLTKP